MLCMLVVVCTGLFARCQAMDTHQVVPSADGYDWIRLSGGDDLRLDCLKEGRPPCRDKMIFSVFGEWSMRWEGRWG